MRMQFQADASHPPAVANSIADSTGNDPRVLESVGPDFHNFDDFLARVAQDSANAALDSGHDNSLAFDVDMHSLMAHDFMM
jgi:hypothetical protein